MVKKFLRDVSRRAIRGIAPRGMLPELFGMMPELSGMMPELSGMIPELFGTMPELFGMMPEYTKVWFSGWMYKFSSSGSY